MYRLLKISDKTSFSFHYCDECSKEGGRKSLGWVERRSEGSDVTIHETVGATQIDDRGVAAEPLSTVLSLLSAM